MRRFARRPSAPAIFLLLAAGFLPGDALGQMPFSPFAARQEALGGASVAVGDDPSAFADNPALLNAAGKSAAISLGYSAVGSGDFVPLLKRVTGNDLAELARPGSPASAGVRTNLNALAAPGTALLGDGRYGIIGTLSGWGISVLSTSWSAASLRADLVHTSQGGDPQSSFLFNDSRVAFRALSLDDYAVTRVLSLTDGVLVGVTGHFMRGTTGIKEESAFLTEVSRLDTFVRRGTSGGIERTRSRFSYDVGASVRIGVLQLGGVMKGVNRPQFPFDDESAPASERGKTVTVGRQTRVGLSGKIPGINLLVAADRHHCRLLVAQLHGVANAHRVQQLGADDDAER